MRDMLKTQEGMDLRLDQRDKELCQLRSQSQVDGAQLAALSLQMQELISSMELRAEVVGKDLEEINGCFYRHRGEINCLKIREKDAKEETEKLKGSLLVLGMRLRFSRTALTGWRRTSAGVNGLPQTLEKSLSLLRMKAGQSCPMLWLLERSTLLLLSKTRFLSSSCSSLLLPWTHHYSSSDGRDLRRTRLHL